ncbi:MAG: nucleotide exchange factor GrpE [Dehalococcoidia bacterium]|nr:nucleotide exchange factor GrpE [Dehalococcoidia bacterium]
MVEENLKKPNTENTSTENVLQTPPTSVEELEKRLREEQLKAERFLANWQRAQADLQNYQKRAEREKAEIADAVRNSVLLSLLSLVDDFDSAVSSIPVEISDNNWMNGFRMIERKLRSFLDSYGISPIDALGKPFDPKYHEAVSRAEGDEGIVIQELRRGYTIKGTVLRPSLVVVGNGRKPEAPAKDGPAPEADPGKKKRHVATEKEENHA